MSKNEPVLNGFLLQELPELSEDVYFAYDSGLHKILYLNASFEKTWELNSTDVYNNLSALINTIHPDDRSQVSECYLALQQNEKQDCEFRIQLPGGKVKWIKINAHICRRTNSNIIVGTAADITSLRDYSDVLHKFNDKKNSILQILSHDLLGP